MGIALAIYFMTSNTPAGEGPRFVVGSAGNSIEPIAVGTIGVTPYEPSAQWHEEGC